MAGSKFQYDESGGTFFYFLLAFLVIVVVPCTYYFWPKDPKKGIVIIQLNLFRNLPKIHLFNLLFHADFICNVSSYA